MTAAAERYKQHLDYYATVEKRLQPLRNRLLVQGDAHLVDCDVCGELHLESFKGDCRDDSNRFASLYDFVERHLNNLHTPRKDVTIKLRVVSGVNT